jgi:chorismate mutase/prephenate dehydratase
MNIKELRTKIDKIDSDILELLNERMDLVHEIGLIKSASNESVYRPEREQEIIDRLNSLSKGKLNSDSIKAVFQEIFAAARNIELPERVAYLGPEGSFTHQAAETNFGSQSEYLPLNSIKAVFDSLNSHKAKYGIIPLENNQEGIVQETIDFLGISKLKIISELPLSISFSFATRSKDLKKIERIYSKDIAFKQCKEFIENYFGDEVKCIPVNSTSAAVSYADKQLDSAAICSRFAAVQKGVPILYDKIEDSKDNHTRFVILSLSQNDVVSKKDKTSILVNLSDGHGVLAQFLQEFHDAKINLTKLESRPAKKGTDFKYVFYIDFEGHYLDKNFQIIYKRYEKNIKLLGSYPRMI